MHDVSRNISREIVGRYQIQLTHLDVQSRGQNIRHKLCWFAHAGILGRRPSNVCHGNLKTLQSYANPTEGLAGMHNLLRNSRSDSYDSISRAITHLVRRVLSSGMHHHAHDHARFVRTIAPRMIDALHDRAVRQVSARPRRCR